MKKHFPFIILTFLFFFLLTFSFPISIFPEMRMFPYLVHKGLIPYKDFFDHHGFLLYYLIAPFITTGGSVQKIIFVILQITSLVLFILTLSILKISKKHFGILTFSYSLILFYLADNTLWYETLVTPFLLMLFLIVSQKKNIFSIIISGALVFFLSAVKPLFIVGLFPVILKWKTIKSIVATAALWIITILYFFKENALYPLYNSLILFNIALPKMLEDSPFKDPYIIMPLVFLSLISLFFLKKHIDKTACIILFLLLSYIPLLTGFWKPHLVPFATFLMVTTSLAMVKNNLFSKIAILVLVLVSLFIVRRIVLEKQVAGGFIPLYADDYKSEKAINYLKENNSNQPLYVFSNRPEFYMELDIIPDVYFPLKFPGSEKYFPDYEINIIGSIKRNNIERIVLVKPLDIEFENQRYLKNWIIQNSNVEYADENAEIRSVRYMGN